jgi:hypothetical protein
MACRCVVPTVQAAVSTAHEAERSIGASCRAWEKQAIEAANPNPEMIARHDELMAKAKKFDAEALAKYSDVSARQAAIENEVQAKMDADAIYDWRYDLKAARDCWRGLDIVQDIHQEQEARLNQLAQQLANAPR